MRVLQVHAKYRHPAGEDTVVANEGNLLRSAGHEVLTWNADPRWSRRVGALAMSTWNPVAAGDVRQTIAEFRPDVAHIHNTWYSLSPSVVAAIKQAGVPVVMTLHNYRLVCMTGEMSRNGKVCTECLDSSPLPGVVHGCYHNSRAASAVAALGIAVWKHLDVWQRNVDRLIAPFTVLRRHDRERRTPRGPHRGEAALRRRPWPTRRMPSDSERVVFVGRLTEPKGLRTLIAAWARRAQKSPGSMQLEIIGEGEVRAELERHAPPGVRFVGWLPHDAALRRLAKARALVFPSEWYETFGMVLLEAMAIGLPIVGSDIAAVREIVEPFHPRQLVAAADPAQLADALDMLEDDAFVDAAGDAARERYLATFTPEHNLKLLTRIYESVGA